MLKLARFVLPLAVFCSYSISDALAALNKCTDGKRITYTTDPCEKTGLVSAGPIKDAVTVTPHFSKPRSDSPGEPGKARVEETSRPKNANPDAEVRKERPVKIIER